LKIQGFENLKINLAKYKKEIPTFTGMTKVLK